MTILKDTERKLNEAQQIQDEQTLTELAKLSLIEFDRVKKAKAKVMNVNVSTLESEVKKRRKVETPEQFTDSLEEEWRIDPYEGAVNGADLLESLTNTFERHLALPDHGAVVAALWTVHTYCHEWFRFSPRLCYTAPEKGCGKTEALEVHHELVYRRLKFENITTATAFRLIAKHKPTLLLDEFDTYLGKRDNEELRGILNAGYQRGGKVPRCEGDNHDVKFFPVFTPVALAGTGSPPATLLDRSIVIRMKRAKRGEIRERLNVYKQSEQFQELRSKIRRWVDDNEFQILNTDPKMPEQAYNRVADKWSPLFQIAQVAGGAWPKRVKDALLATLAIKVDTDSIGVMLLEDIRRVWPEDEEKVHSEELVDKLVALEGRPWPEYGRTQKPITANKLARLLGKYDIKASQQKIHSRNKNGYERRQFHDSWDRYLSPSPKNEGDVPSHPLDQNSTALPANNGAGFSEIQNSTASSEVEFSICRKANNDAGCREVEFSKGGMADINKDDPEQDRIEVAI